MDKIKFNDGTMFEIEEGASLGEVVHIAPNETDALYICSMVTPENVRHLEFLHNDAVIGSYDNLTVAAPTTRENGEEDEVIVRMHFRVKSAIELRLDALEESQEIQDGAIEDIATVLSDLVEE